MSSSCPFRPFARFLDRARRGKRRAAGDRAGQALGVGGGFAVAGGDATIVGVVGVADTACIGNRRDVIRLSWSRARPQRGLDGCPALAAAPLWPPCARRRAARFAF